MDLYENRSLTRGFSILETLNEARDRLTLAELTRRTGIHRATVFRLLAVLCAMGYVHKDEHLSLYSIGCRMHGFGKRSKVIANVTAQVRPLLRQLAYEVGEVAVLSTREGPQVIHWEAVDPNEPGRSCIPVGTHLDAHATAAGKALLAHCKPQELSAIYATHALAAHTRYTMRSREALKRDLARALERGYAIENQELMLGRRALATPILCYGGRAKFVVSLAGEVSRITERRIPQLAKAVLATSKLMAERIAAERTDPRQRADPGSDAPSPIQTIAAAFVGDTMGPSQMAG